MRAARLIFWTLTALYWVLICVLTHLPPREIGSLTGWLHLHLDDKTEHMLAYGALAGLLAMALWVTFPRRPWLVWGVFLIAILYGAADEQTQRLVGRTCDLDDWIADAVGAMAGILPVIVVQRFIRLPHTPAVKRTVAPVEPLGTELEAVLEAIDSDRPLSLNAPSPRPSSNGHRAPRSRS